MVWRGTKFTDGSSRSTIGGVNFGTLRKRVLPDFCFLEPRRLGRSPRSIELDMPFIVANHILNKKKKEKKKGLDDAYFEEWFPRRQGFQTMEGSLRVSTSPINTLQMKVVQLWTSNSYINIKKRLDKKESNKINKRKEERHTLRTKTI